MWYFVRVRGVRHMMTKLTSRDKRTSGPNLRFHRALHSAVIVRKTWFFERESEIPIPALISRPIFANQDELRSSSRSIAASSTSGYHVRPGFGGIWQYLVLFPRARLVKAALHRVS